MKKKNNKEIRKCLSCGKILLNNEEYCQNCGIKFGETKKIICPNCKNEVEFGKKYCGKCGEKLDVKIKEKLDFTKNCFAKNKIWKKIIIILICLLILIGLIAGGIKIYKNFTISVDELILQERYEEAYKKGNEEEKNKVVDDMIQKGKFKEAYSISNNHTIAFTNEIAYYCKEISEGLKDKSSFLLRNVYFDEENQKIVLAINAKNSYGGSVINYWYYKYDEEGNKYKEYKYISSLEKETIYNYADTLSEKIEKQLNNLARTEIISIMSKEENKVDDSIIDNINTLFKNTNLKDVEFPDYEISSAEGNI